jgi:hypothetical protein
MNLWCFGDSYVDQRLYFYDYPSEWKQNKYKSWILEICDRFDYTYYDYSFIGSSLDYTFKKFNDYRFSFNKNDVIIIATTNLNRRWFIKNSPQLSHTGFPEKDYPYNYLNALKQYILYLEHEEIYVIYLLDFLYNVHALTEKLNLHTIILPCFKCTEDIIVKNKFLFPNFHIADGNLHNISINEYSENLDPNIFRDHDGKINHFIWSNHRILANKIIDNIANKTKIDLTNGFIEGVINSQSIKNKEFIEQELKLNPFN